MSVIQFPQGMNSIWDNEAFDNGESEEDSSTIMKASWPPSEKSLVLSPCASVNSFSDKENNNLLENSSHSVVVKSHSSSMPLAALNSNGVLENSRIKTVSKLGLDEKLNCRRDEKKIEKEMEEIEREISRLSSKLEALRIEKFEKSVAVAEKRGNDVKNLEGKKMVEQAPTASARTMMQRRRLSLCPQEMIPRKTRGLSLGPAEIMKSGQLGKQERMVTSVQATPQSRRKSCFWKLQDIGEEISKARDNKSLSLSPKSRKSTITNQALRQVATTVASKKAVKKEDGIGSSIQPKKLFKDGEKFVTTNKKAAPRPGRVIASRYNQNTAQAPAVRKRSLPEDEDDGSKRCDKKRSISAGKSRVTLTESKSLATEIRVKKRWEIPSELVVHRSSEADNSPLTIVVPDLLPRIKTSRCINETPRDSGPAKRVIDLIGRKPYFSIDEEHEPAVCQTLSFAEVEEN